ncbi:hypothetical protein CC2G_013060 [Coprinopsis cinerea AmutBmut pab1-1]|nr:hypothetical protein CC2G_013060 [Coprinopsis cinerea AmutBmut pab1-1]
MRSVEKNKKKNVDNHSGVLLKSVPNTRPTLVQPKKPKPQKIKGTCQKTTPIATSSFNVPLVGGAEVQHRGLDPLIQDFTLPFSKDSRCLAGMITSSKRHD